MDDLQPMESAQNVDDAQPVETPPSILRRVFRNRFHHWRAGWRILVYCILLFLGIIGLSALIAWLVPEPDGGMMSWGYSLSMALFDLMLIAVAWLVLWRFDRRPIALLGMGLERGWWRELAIGVAAGIVTTGGLTLVLVVTGMVSLELSPDLAEALRVMPRFFVLFTVAGAAEELVFRGYILQVLGEGSRRWIAAVLTSLPFAVVHLDNPDVTFAGIANIFLVGLVFAILYYQTLRLWLPIGFHLSWNWAHGWFWGFDVSGIELQNQVFVATPTGPDLLTGGEFGLEGSVLTTALIVVVGVWLLTRKVLTPITEMTALWAPYPRGFGMAPIENLELVKNHEVPDGTEEIPVDTMMGSGE
jgi:membrane protease YdiL (CAAX protease family)